MSAAVLPAFDFDLFQGEIPSKDDWDHLDEVSIGELQRQLEERFQLLAANGNALQIQSHRRARRSTQINVVVKAVLFSATALVGAFNLIDIYSDQPTKIWDMLTLFTSIFAAFIASCDGYFAFSKEAREALTASQRFRSTVASAEVAWETRFKGHAITYDRYVAGCRILVEFVAHLNALRLLDPASKDRADAPPTNAAAQGAAVLGG